jgi:hypothetical protein
MAAIMVALPALDFMQPRVAHGLGWRVADPPRQVAQAIKADLPAGEAVHVVNYHPIVYALAGVTPVTRFAFSEHLSGYFSDLIGVDANVELARVLASRPWFLVVAPGRWDRIRPEARSAVEAALAEAYTLVKVVPDGDGPVQLWRRR